MANAEVLWDEVVALGGYASRRLPRGARLLVRDAEGDACVQLLVHNANAIAERLNVADTVKVQWQAYLAEDALLLSDMGRVLMTVERDTSARHDCLCGVTNARSAATKYGDGAASGATPNARDLLALGVAKFGLARADVGPALNLFKGVRVAPDGVLLFEGAPAPDGEVQLRAELDVVVTLANTPHVLDPRPSYEGNAVRVVAWVGPAAPPDDAARLSSPERQRAFENTDEWLLGR
ncbi:MAG: DUF1989 domain-containing protein [Acidimicrobiales bacterium]|nr:DUF1989 domain-containing protein [Acidimicrobiales bacterium]